MDDSDTPLYYVHRNLDDDQRDSTLSPVMTSNHLQTALLHVRLKESEQRIHEYLNQLPEDSTPTAPPIVSSFLDEKQFVPIPYANVPIPHANTIMDSSRLERDLCKSEAL